jgi:hypothetical protein
MTSWMTHFALFLMICALHSSSARATGAGNFEVAVNLLRSMNLQKTWEANMDAMVNQMSGGDPHAMQTIAGAMKKWMSYRLVEPKLAEIYSKFYTNEEMKELHKFYQSPLGRKSLDLQPKILVESVKLTQALLEPHAHEIEALMKGPPPQSNPRKK